MSNFLISICCVLLYALNGPVQPAQNIQADKSADAIVGTYSLNYQGENSLVKISRESDGTYSAKVTWVKNRIGNDGKVRKDAKNPDKSLRDVDCDKIVLIKGLKYDESEKVWDSTKIYDPTHGIYASVRVWFKDSKTLALKGTKMGISETVYWTRQQ